MATRTIGAIGGLACLVPQLAHVHSRLRRDLILRPVLDEDRLTTPLDRQGLTHVDLGEVELRASHSEHVPGSAHARHELAGHSTVSDSLCRLGSKGKAPQRTTGAGNHCGSRPHLNDTEAHSGGVDEVATAEEEVGVFPVVRVGHLREQFDKRAAGVRGGIRAGSGQIAPCPRGPS